MKTVWKYVLDLDGVQHIAMPADAKILHVAVQHQMLCMWCEVTPWASPDEMDKGKTRGFVVVGTGHPVPDGALHLGSALMMSDNLVLHLYEVPL